jgi:hypothetical protein
VDAKGHPAGKEAVTAGRADGGGGLGVGEAQPFAGEPVDVRRGDFGYGVVTADIPVAEVIGEDEDDVGWGGGSRCVGRRERGRDPRSAMNVKANFMGLGGSD